MYYHAIKKTSLPLYRTNEEAQRLLFALHAKLMDRQVTIIDYLLEPHTCQLILQTKKRIVLPTFAIRPIAKERLLWYLSSLGSKGKAYPYSGLHECYFLSTCFCELGKVTADPLPYPLKEILAVKNGRAE
ncbi:MAG: hypothetical protein GX911_07555 [Spirochaetales bacterium]|nr:hypothetical protein [Spirochaetales bacterium]